MPAISYTEDLYENYNTYSKYGYLYYCIVTFLDGSKAYKLGYTCDANTRFKKDTTIKSVDFISILPHNEEHHRGLPASKYTMWEALSHKHAAQVLDYRTLVCFRENVKAKGFSGYSECYPHTDEAAAAIENAIMHVNELIKSYTDNVWF